MMDTKTKLMIGAGVIALFAIFAYIVKIQHDIINKQNNIATKIVEFKQLGDGIARVESRMTTDRKDLETQLKSLGVDYSKIQTDLDSNKAQLEAVAVSIGRTEGLVKFALGSDWQELTDPFPPSTPTTPIDTTCTSAYGYCNNKQGLNLYEPGPNEEKIPFGTVAFNSASPKPWDLVVYPRKYYSVLSIGRNDQGTVYAHSQFMIEDNKGVKHKVAVDDKSFYEQVDQTYRFYWWNPRFVGGYSLGARTNGSASSTVGLQMYTSAYTANHSRPTWMFFGLGAGYDMSNQNFAAILSPVAYNLFHTTDLIQNLYVAPTVSMATDGGIGVSGTISLIF